MRWKGREGSEHVEDRRGGGGGGPLVFGGIGMLIMALVFMLLGQNPFKALQTASEISGGSQAHYKPANPAEDEAAQMVSVVLRDTEEIWTHQFEEYGLQYRKPKLVLFSGQTRSLCGFANAAVGPFYCPSDETIYVDLSFFTLMKKRFGAYGDFPPAYVIAHEVGHHVQKQLGISDLYQREMMRALRTQGKAAANQWTVRMELQADFLAGVWTRHANERFRLLEEGDIEEALNAAAQIGDDALQMKSRGYIVPDSFTHGTSRQRATWFRYGLETGDMTKGDTFDDEVFYRVTPPQGR